MQTKLLIKPIGNFYSALQKKFGFHQSFIKTTLTLYNCPRARIKINGAISNSFSLEQGSRQRCSKKNPLLFAVFEALSHGITQDNNITGMKMLGQEHKMSFFVDEILIYLSNPEFKFEVTVVLISL